MNSMCAISCRDVRSDRVYQDCNALLLSLKHTHYETAKMALEAIAHKVMGTLSTFYKRQVAYELTKYGELLRSMQKMTTGSKNTNWLFVMLVE